MNIAVKHASYAIFHEKLSFCKTFEIVIKTH